MTDRPRKIRKKPLRISYEEFRNADSVSACCAGGEQTTTLVSLVAREKTAATPAAILDEMLSGGEGLSVHGAWHHVLVGELLLVGLRNAGYQISDEVIDEVIDRGRQLPGGSCGFLGACGALVSAASAYAILLGSTPVAQEARQKTLAFTARLHARLAEVGGSRCCKKSSYLALECAQAELAQIGFELPVEEFVGRCPFYEENEKCDGVHCPYFPSK